MPSDYFRIGIINFFVFIALLRLTNFNYYLSGIIGLETEINNTGGNAFNFINYIGVAFLGIIILVKLNSLEARWKSAWGIYLLMTIYFINALCSPYINLTWVVYQELFLLIALVLHLYAQKVSCHFVLRFKRGTRYIFWASIGLVSFCTVQILFNNSLSYYFKEFNEVFVQTLDDFGIMKQRYGYLLGFLVSYILFVLKGIPKKVLLIGLILITGFGIRSFIIGMIGAIAIFTIRSPRQFFLFFTIIAFSSYYFFGTYIELLIYDTRFYSFLNAFDIIQNFPFGVGLGGYQIYTEEFSRQLYAAFFDASAILDYIPSAPESDLVHLFGSLGLIFGFLHLLIQFRIVWLTYILQKHFNSFQKCILFYFCFMTFFGISEDSIFSINYWIFFGLASGIVMSTKYQIVKENRDEG